MHFQIVRANEPLVSEMRRVESLRKERKKEIKRERERERERNK